MLLEAYQDELWSEPDKGAESNEYLEWMGLLRSATAFEAYCKVYTADLSPERILEFLLLDEEFPHSLRFAIDSLQHALVAIDKESAISQAGPLRRQAGRLQASLNYASVDEILDQDIVAYLQNIQAQCEAIHTTVYRLYVDYSIQAALGWLVVGGGMYYSIRHLTKFLYSDAVSESMMETRMHPRSDQNQRCLTFHLSVSPRCRVFGYRDHLSNHVHHFDIPQPHGQLVIVAESLVDVQPAVVVPASLPEIGVGGIGCDGGGGGLLGDAFAQ